MAFLLSSRTWLAPVTLPSRADEAEDRRSKFYADPDNLRHPDGALSELLLR
jgi:hypothetical protein